MEILGKIFGSETKVKIMRLFLFNPGQIYDAESVSERAKAKIGDTKKELANLAKVGLIKPRKFVIEIQGKSKGKEKIVFKKKQVQGWILNNSFMYVTQLQGLLINTILLKESDVVRRVSQLGKIKLVVVAGVFIGDWDSRADILVVGERIKESQLRFVIKKMEAEIGKELKYAALETTDFQYRMSVGDKLVRDIFDYPHKVISDRLGMNLAFKAIRG